MKNHDGLSKKANIFRRVSGSGVALGMGVSMLFGCAHAPSDTINKVAQQAILRNKAIEFGRVALGNSVQRTGQQNTLVIPIWPSQSVQPTFTGEPAKPTEPAKPARPVKQTGPIGVSAHSWALVIFQTTAYTIVKPEDVKSVEMYFGPDDSKHPGRIITQSSASLELDPNTTPSVWEGQLVQRQPSMPDEYPHVNVTTTESPVQNSDPALRTTDTATAAIIQKITDMYEPGLLVPARKI